MTMRTLALFVAFIILAPAAFTVATPPAHAIAVQETGPVAGLVKSILGQDTISAIKETATYIETVTNTAANYAKYIKSYVLDPIAFITSGNLLKSITSSILGFVAGKNGTGKPLYVQNLRGYLQNVGDVEAYSFINQFQKNSNSPFAGAITSSLRADYLQQTSAAGFFAANKSTLASVSSNPLAFVAGDWSKGGLLAWFGLTTQDQNNPYILNYRAQGQLARQYNEARGAKLAQANWGQGILSYCGSGSGLSAAADQVGGTPTGEESSLNCPEGAVPTGTICGYPGSIDAPGSYVLPTGYSCPGGSNFDNVYGGCEYQEDGTFTAPLDASGEPVYGSGDSGSVSCTANCPPGNACVATGPAGCSDTTAHNYIPPNGFSCPGGGTFNNLTGGCQYGDGLNTYPQPPAGTVAGNTTAAKIASAASSYYGIATNMGPDGGNLACAWAVNNVLRNAGISPIGGNSVASVETALRDSRGTLVTQSDAQAGDIVLCNPCASRTGPSGPGGHVGICENDGCTSVISNNSGTASFTKRTDASFNYPANVTRIYRVNGTTAARTGSSLIASAYTALDESSSGRTGQVLGSQLLAVANAISCPSNADFDGTTNTCRDKGSGLIEIQPLVGVSGTGMTGSSIGAYSTEDITPASTVPNDAFGSLPSGTAAAGGAAPSATPAGGSGAGGLGSSVRPGDPCTKADGSEGKIQTPGSIIKSYLTKALGSSIDKLAGVGDISTQISGIMSNIGTVMSTVNAATSLFGGSGSGIEGFSGTGTGYTSPFQDYLSSSAYMGLTASDVGEIPTPTAVPVPGTAVDTTGTGKLVVTKTELSPGAGTIVSPGDTISYRIHITSVVGDQTNLKITDATPVYGSLSVLGGGTDSNSANSVGYKGGMWWLQDSAEDGWTGYVGYDITVDANAPAGTKICNTAQASSDQVPQLNTNTVCNTVGTSTP